MTKRKELIELIINADTYDSYECKLCTKDDDACDCCYAEKLADQILADGWIKPPCKVGDKVYTLVNIGGTSPTIVEGVVVYHEDDGCKSWKLELYLYDQFGEIIDAAYRNVYEEQFGKCVFLSREEAEKALKEQNDEK